MKFNDVEWLDGTQKKTLFIPRFESATLLK